MESLSEILEPYKDYVAKAAQLLTLVQIASPIPVFYGMSKTKSTNGMPSLMFLLITVFTALGTRFSVLINDDASFNSNAIGLALSVVYVTIFYYYIPAAEKSAEYKKLFATIAFIVGVLVYSEYEDPEKIEHRFGLIFTALFLGFMILPIMDTMRAFKEKSTKHMPFPMIITGFFVGLSWFLHGIIIQSGFVIVIKFDKFSLN
ncbi:hypothetical protein ACKWTF_011166 [Chironomus riparius]